jgi:hypothetical protein
VDPARLYDALLSVALKLGVEIRVERLLVDSQRAGGLCRLRGRQLVLLDDRSSTVERSAALAEALSELDLEGIYMPPEARLVVEAARRAAPAPTLAAELLPKPGLRTCREPKP